MKIPIMNGSGAFGRVAGTYLAGLYGPFDLQVGCTLVTAATIWAVLGVSVVKFNKSNLIPFNVDMNFRIPVRRWFWSVSCMVYSLAHVSSHFSPRGLRAECVA
jgi:hypothetical protein